MLLEKIKNSVKRHRLIRPQDKIVVGVSGGPDSLCLLYALNALRKEFHLELHIAHLDHMLRRDSALDAEFVSGLAKKLKIPVTVAQINLKKLAPKSSREEIARNCRLGFFFRVARDIKARKIALGHNLDDQAETVLMRILRGTGLYGLIGILPRKEIAGFEIIRPLIEIRRKEITAFLKRKKIKPRIDSSNFEDIYLRNKVRNRLLPLLERKFNPGIKERLSSLAQSAGDDYDYLKRAAEVFIKGKKNKLNLESLKKLHPAPLRLVLRLSISRIKGDTRRLTFRHIQELEDLIASRPANSIVDLPQGISVKKEKKYLFFYKRKTP